MQPQPSFRAYLASMLFLIIVGWGGLAALVIFTAPTVWPRWGFFLLWVMALTGLALPISYFVNQRFPSDPPAEPNVIVRQALWAGVFGATIAWLQLGRLVTLWVIFGLAGGLIAIEYFLRMRERARWNPPLDPDEPT
jgi:hypothetical protein